MTRRPASARIFDLLVALFPREFRERFGDDMRDVFDDQLAAARARGTARAMLLRMRATGLMLRAALLEHADARRERRRARARAPFTVGGDGMIATLAADLRFAARMLRRTPVFTAVAIVVVALGTGGVSTIYSAANALFLRPIPGTTDGDRLIGWRRIEPDGDGGLTASHEYISYLRNRSRSLSGIAGWSRVGVSLATNSAVGGHALSGSVVTGNYFDVLGVRPALGRFFVPEEDSVPLAHPVVVISHAFWTAQLGADPSVLERPAIVNGHPYRIIGVAPPGFHGVFTPIRIDAWIPVAMHGQIRPSRTVTPHTPWLWPIGRLADGVSRDAADRELASLTAGYAATSGEPARYASGTGVAVTPLTGLPDDARGVFIGFFAILFTAATLVLIIACVNVASMLSARSLARRREMALRTALGAARGRLVRQLLTESLLLFGIGALGGVGLAWIATSALEGLHIPFSQGLSLEISPDANVLLFALAVALGSGVIAGLAPALRGAERNISARLRAQNGSGDGRRSFMGNALIVGQLALSLALLVVGGLFGRALAAGASVDPGFEQEGVLVASFDPVSWGYDSLRARAFYTTLAERAAAIPGVSVAEYTEEIPLVFADNRMSLQLPRGGAVDTIAASFASVGAEYFDVLRVPVIRGRALARADLEPGAPRVAVINQRFADRWFPDGDALGRTFTRFDETFTIVGVAANAKYASLTESTPPFVYLPIGGEGWLRHRWLLVRAEPGGDAAATGRDVQRIVRDIDPAVPRPVVGPLSDETSLALLPQRVASLVTGTLGGLGLFLAAVGLYGVMSYSTGRRTREMGIRMAVGARARDVLAMILREGMRLATIGVVVGLALAAFAAQLMTRFLFGVSPLDAVAFAGTSVLFVLVALVACYVPARRAAASDPVVVLRSD